MSDADARAAEFEQRLEREKLAALVEFAYGAGHEINNPLANIAARAQTLLEDEPDPERRRKLAAIRRQAMRAHEMIADLMLFARPPKLEIAADRPAANRAASRRGTTDAGRRAVGRACAANWAMGRLPSEADATQLAVAIAAVVINAIEAVGRKPGM